MAGVEQAQARITSLPRAARSAVATIFFVNGMLVANWVARIPDVKQHLRLSDGSLGLTLLFMALGALIAQPTSGWMISKIGSRRVTTFSALVLCGVVILPGIATSQLLLIPALLLFGGCNGGLDVAMNAQAALVEQQYRRPIMSSFHGLWSVGGLMGASLGGVMASHRIPLPLHFLGVAVVGLIVMLIALRYLISDQGTHAAQGTVFALPPRSLLPMGIIAFCVLFSEGAIGDWSAIYLRDTLHSTPGVAAGAFAVFSLLMAAGRLTGDWLTLKLGAPLLVRISGAFVTVGIALALLSTTPTIAIIGFGLVGAGVACVFPLILSAASQTPGIASGTAIAAMATSGYTGFLVGPPLIGFIANEISLRGALVLLAVFGVLVMLSGGLIRDVHREQTPHDA